jgi:hypothetical protein
MMMAACRQDCVLGVALGAAGNPRGGVLPRLFKRHKGAPIGIEQARRLFETALQLIDAKDIDIKALVVKKTTKDKESSRSLLLS